MPHRHHASQTPCLTDTMPRRHHASQTPCLTDTDPCPFAAQAKWLTAEGPAVQHTAILGTLFFLQCVRVREFGIGLYAVD